MMSEDAILVMTGGLTYRVQISREPDVQLDVLSGGHIEHDGVWRLVAVKADGTCLLQEAREGDEPGERWWLADEDWN